MIFRKVALERLSSPEQLDQMVQVTDPKGWLALAGIGVLLLAAIGWGVFGSIPTEAQGTGILLRQGGVSDLVANAAGQVQEVLVGVGDLIEKGQPVARIQQSVLLRQIADDRSKQRLLQSQYADAVRIADQQKRLRARDLAQERSNLERSGESLEKDVALLRERLDAQQALLNDGLITKETFLTTQQSLNAKRDQLAQARLDLNGLDLKRIEADQVLDQQLEARQTAIRDLDLDLRELNAKLGENVNILSPYSGRVLEVLANRGDVVNPGSAILSVEVLSENLQAVLFVPASTGKQVQRGMAVQLSPSTVKREEYGSLLGKVTWVAEFPSTSRGMIRLLGNEALVTKLMEQGPPIQVNVDLARDPATPTGYRWSSSRGPNLRISSGTLATGDIVIKRDLPVYLIIPKVREATGL
ncbi:MAG TPA: NHLP bacteriocin system secretion protein [Thermoanaerobaculia bacterium]|jgi:HlyD family secretion protein|nr:NHLP bacteriocin system secretion protein [Thermoanaerobaculia bacterium]